MNKQYKRKRRSATARFYGFIAVAAVLIAGIALGIMALSGAFRASTPTLAEPDPVVQSTPGATDDYAQYAGAPTDEPDPTPVPESEYITIEENDLSVTSGLSPDWYNLLLLGEDTRVSGIRGRTDSMIIVSIHVKTGQVKTLSVLRDMMVEIPDRGERRLNSAHEYGGPELTMKLINEYFGLNITRYMTANFTAFPRIIDALGGITIANVTEEESQLIDDGVGNGIFEEKVREALADWEALDNSFLEGKYGANLRLTGRQALAYARIRKDSHGTDFYRTSRQREVLWAVLQEVKNVREPLELLDIARDLLQVQGVKTNLDINDMIQLALIVLPNVDQITYEQSRIPRDGTYVGATRPDHNGTPVQAFYDIDFEANKQYLHNFIYGDGT